MTSSLIPFHKVLIATAIVFCLGFSAYEAVAFVRTREPLAFGLAAGFAAAGVALAFYLRHLRRWLRLR